MKSYNSYCGNCQSYNNCSDYQNCNTCQNSNRYPNDTHMSCKSALSKALQLFIRSDLQPYTSPNTFTLYTPYLTTPQDATSINNSCNCMRELLKFQGNSPYSMIPMCDLEAFTIRINNPLTNLQQVKTLLSNYFYEGICDCRCCSCEREMSYEEDIKHYLSCQSNPINLLVGNASFTNLQFIGLYGPLACFIQTGVTSASPSVPFARILVVCINNISAIGTAMPK